MVELRAWMDGKFDNLHKNFILKALKIFESGEISIETLIHEKTQRACLKRIEQLECKRLVKYWIDKKIMLKGGHVFNAWGNLNKLFKYGWGKGEGWGGLCKGTTGKLFPSLEILHVHWSWFISWHGVHDLVCHAKEIKGQFFTHWNYIKGTWIQTSPCSISGHLHNPLKQALDLVEIIVLYQFCLSLVLCVHSNIPSIATCLGFMVHTWLFFVCRIVIWLFCGTCKLIWLKRLFPWMLMLMVLDGCIVIMARWQHSRCVLE